MAKHCEMTETEILVLENAQCIPGHTYEMRQMSVLSCSGIDTALSEHTSLVTTYYYHSSIYTWIQQAKAALKKQSLSVLAFTIKSQFTEQLAAALGGIKTPGCQSFDQAWAYWVDGTWGKCLKEISVPCLAKKELSRHIIVEMMPQDPATLSAEAKTKLTQAVNDYIAASLEFDPYGMRHTLAEDPIKKFDLRIG